MKDSFNSQYHNTFKNQAKSPMWNISLVFFHLSGKWQCRGVSLLYKNSGEFLVALLRSLLQAGQSKEPRLSHQHSLGHGKQSILSLRWCRNFLGPRQDIQGFLPCRKACKDENCHCYCSSVFSNDYSIEKNLKLLVLI